jgi:NADH:ubiquinone oxidoreductase subunit 6 (subunit J)
MSLLLIAAGAVLAIAVNYSVTGIDIKAIGAILIVVGAIGLLFSLIFMLGFFGSHADEHHGHV